MMNKDKNRKEEGDKILSNYKKQIAEKMARERAEKGEINNLNNGGYSSKRFNNKSLTAKDFGNYDFSSS